LFYNKTDFLLDRFSVVQFVKSVDLEKLKEYTLAGIISLHYQNSAIGTFQFPKGKGLGIGPMVTKSQAFNISQYVNQGYLELLGNKAIASKKADEFLELCSPMEYTDAFQDDLKSECEDGHLLTSQLKIYISSYFPQLDLSSLQLTIEDKFDTPFGQSVYIYSSNFNPDELNKKYSSLLPQGHSLDWTSFLLSSNESSGDLNIASQYSAELFTDVRHYPFIQGRVTELVNKVSKSEKDISIFQDIVLERYKPVREVINSGERSFQKFTKILDKSLEYKKWSAGTEDDLSLLSQYYEAVTKGS